MSFLGLAFKKLAASTSCLLGHLLLEPSHLGRGSCGGELSPWPVALAGILERRQHWPASRVSEPYSKWIFQALEELSQLMPHGAETSCLHRDFYRFVGKSKISKTGTRMLLL